MKFQIFAVLALCFSHSCFAISLTGTDHLDIVNDDHRFVRAYDESSLSLYSDADVAFLNAYDNSRVTLSPGSELSWYFGYDSSSVDAYGGDVSWMFFQDTAEGHVYGLEDLSWLRVSSTSDVNIYGNDFSYSRGHLSGSWLDGSLFSFWALEDNAGPTNPKPIQITNTIPSGIRLHSAHAVPEVDASNASIAIAFLYFGMAFMNLKIRRRQ